MLEKTRFIKENLEEVRESMRLSCMRANREIKTVKLIAVSKTKPIFDMLKAYDFGVRDFGENKVQEILSKYDKMPKDIRWHMIGHLQRNKVKQIIDKVFLIHSVDSYALAYEIEEQAYKRDINVNVLVEVNIGNEDSKFGVSANETYELVSKIMDLEHVSVKGLMCVAPIQDDPENNRKYFRKMKAISDDINNKLGKAYLNVLSMGMTGDFEVAIEEGATMVRVGTGIFGERKRL
ncbi:MAG: YggS family pyridoxal phosphate-dependent enzyme [Lachnospiraceae bacterium]|nr:YggS family pyridoxal phosphate-dependent enzyme [Lachnospiraceae bacterium]